MTDRKTVILKDLFNISLLETLFKLYPELRIEYNSNQKVISNHPNFFIYNSLNSFNWSSTEEGHVIWQRLVLKVQSKFNTYHLDKIKELRLHNMLTLIEEDDET